VVVEEEYHGISEASQIGNSDIDLLPAIFEYQMEISRCRIILLRKWLELTSATM